jgi:hypothetical protein
MKTMVCKVLGVLLIAGLITQIAPAAERNVRNAVPSTVHTTQKFRNANGSANLSSSREESCDIVWCFSSGDPVRQE